MTQPTSKDPQEPSALTAKQQAALDELLADAVRQRNLARVEACIDKGARTDCLAREWDGSRGLYVELPLAICAVRYFNNEVYASLVRNGMPIDAKDADGDTALMFAVQEKSIDKIKTLIALGASPLHTNNRGIVVLGAAKDLAQPGDSVREAIIDALLAGLPSVKERFNKAAEAVIEELPKTLDKPVPAVKSIVFNDDAPPAAKRLTP